MPSDSQPSEARVTRWESIGTGALASRLSSLRVVVCVAVAAAAIVGPVALGLRSALFYGWALTLTAASAVLLGFFRAWDRSQLGLCWPPRPSLRFWVVVTSVLGTLLLAALLLAGIQARAGVDSLGLCTPLPYSRAISMQVLSVAGLHPVFEEILFRFVLCGALLGWLPDKAIVLVSGVSFALIHVLYGVGSADNAVAGFILAWAFLRSRSLVVPIALHSLGNAALLIILRDGPLRRLACP